MSLSPAKQRLVLVALVAAAVAVAIAANWALLGYADRREGTIGTLSPKATSLAPERPPVTPGAIRPPESGERGGDD